MTHAERLREMATALATEKLRHSKIFHSGEARRQQSKYAEQGRSLLAGADAIDEVEVLKDENATLKERVARLEAGLDVLDKCADLLLTHGGPR